MDNFSKTKSADDTLSRESLRVFLCHSSGDKPQVRKLYERLRAYGIDPWFDEETLLPGQDWNREIPKGVRASDVVIVCLSRGSVTKAGYIQKEIKFALDAADEQPEGTIFIIPLKLEECDVPDRLSRWQWVNLYEPKGYERLIRALKTRAREVGANVVDPAIPSAVEHQGNDIYADLWVTQTEVNERRVLGVIAPGDRPIKMQLSPDMTDGVLLRMRGLGSEEKGDLYLRVRHSKSL